MVMELELVVMGPAGLCLGIGWSARMLVHDYCQHCWWRQLGSVAGADSWGVRAGQGGSATHSGAEMKPLLCKCCCWVRLCCLLLPPAGVLLLCL
jgi:hypothetical protein